MPKPQTPYYICSINYLVGVNNDVNFDLYSFYTKNKEKRQSHFFTIAYALTATTVSYRDEVKYFSPLNELNDCFIFSPISAPIF